MPNEPEASQDMAPSAAPRRRMTMRPESKGEAPVMMTMTMPLSVAPGQVRWPLIAATYALGVAATPRQLIPKGLAGVSQ